MGKKYEFRKKFTYEGHTFDVVANTEEELGEKIAKKKFEVDRALSTTGGATIVNRWVEHYFDTYVGDSVSVGTRADRERMYKNHIRPYIGSLRIRSVTAGQCQQIVNRMDGYSKDRVNKLCQLLFNIFDKARKERLIVQKTGEGELPPCRKGRLCFYVLPSTGQVFGCGLSYTVVFGRERRKDLKESISTSTPE